MCSGGNWPPTARLPAAFGLFYTKIGKLDASEHVYK